MVVLGMLDMGFGGRRWRDIRICEGETEGHVLYEFPRRFLSLTFSYSYDSHRRTPTEAALRVQLTRLLYSTWQR